MSTALEHFYKVTAVNGWDIAFDGMRPNVGVVSYCPVDTTNYNPLVTEGISQEQNEYIAKSAQYIKDHATELEPFMDVPVETLINIASDSIIAGWKDMMDKGHTVGVMFEANFAAGAGLVAGFFVAFDKSGRSILGFAGISAGIAVGMSGVIGGFYYEGTRDGLEGFSGEFNASLTLLVGLEWEAMFTGGSTGHVVGVTGGGSIQLSVEFQHAWLIHESHR